MPSFAKMCLMVQTLTLGATDFVNSCKVWLLFALAAHGTCRQSRPLTLEGWPHMVRSWWSFLSCYHWMNLHTMQSCLRFVNCCKTSATLWCTFHSLIISPFSISERHPIPRVFSFILGGITWIEVVGSIVGLRSMISFQKYFCPITVLSKLP
ncbi:hypothetical protein L873DRAFT_1881743, partial [Choiromyces venosus 120613-1]